jgi:hypothetical protein
MGGGRGSAVEIGGQKGEPGGHAANSSNRFHIFEGRHWGVSWLREYCVKNSIGIHTHCNAFCIKIIRNIQEKV